MTERNLILSREDIVLPLTFMMLKHLGAEHLSNGFVTLGMFIIDDFSFADNDGVPTGKTLDSQE